MPREKKKVRKKAISPAPVDDDDTASTTSEHSQSTAHMSEEDGISEEEQYEAKVREAIDLASVKSVHTRTNALISLKTALQKKILTCFLLDNYQTMTDLVEKSLKKGRGMEQVAASKLASVLVMSLLDTAESEQVFKTLEPIMSVIIQDPAASADVRLEVTRTLALMTYLVCPEPADIPIMVNNLYKVFSPALPKGNGELPTHSPAVIALHTAAIQGVCLLLDLLPKFSVVEYTPKWLNELTPVLGSTDVDQRIMIGEAIALVYESVRARTEEFRWPRDKENNLRNILNELATDSHKYRAKKERKQQRASFREVLKTVEEDEFVSEIVTVGPTQARQDIHIDSWSLRFQYEALVHALDIGFNNHMTFNPGLRKLFDMGPPPAIIPGSLAIGHRAPKKPNHESPAVKARSLARSKNRDNRKAALAYDD